jgi:D-arabinose 1-dehydrogenase-like Zn-dependent alcohol dehydrogenase
MKKRKLGNSNLEVSAIGLGCMTMSGGYSAVVEKQEMISTIRGAVERGVTYLYEALQIAASGKVKVMTETYPLTEITKAYERVFEGKVRFRAVIMPGN